MLRATVCLLLVSTTLAAASSVLACGEGVFHMGDGLRFQGYLASRPATVLVFDGERAPAADKIAVYRGLVQAGHSLTIAHDADELSQALEQRRYDIVVAGIDAIESVSAALPSAASMPRLLPVVDRSRRNAPDLRERFGQILVEGASLGQYLRQINQLMKS